VHLDEIVGVERKVKTKRDLPNKVQAHLSAARERKTTRDTRSAGGGGEGRGGEGNTT